MLIALLVRAAVSLATLPLRLFVVLPMRLLAQSALAFFSLAVNTMLCLGRKRADEDEEAAVHETVAMKAVKTGADAMNNAAASSEVVVPPPSVAVALSPLATTTGVVDATSVAPIDKTEPASSADMAVVQPMALAPKPELTTPALVQPAPKVAKVDKVESASCEPAVEMAIASPPPVVELACPPSPPPLPPPPPPPPEVHELLFSRLRGEGLELFTLQSNARQQSATRRCWSGMSERTPTPAAASRCSSVS